MDRILHSIARSTVARRMVHKGANSTPPLRFTPVPEKIALFSFITFTILSYPTYVLCNLDDMRPKDDNRLSEEVQVQIDKIRASRK